MVTLIVALSVGWIVVSIVVGLLLGTAMNRLDTAGTQGRRRSQGWKVASATKTNGRPVMLLARTTHSPHRRDYRR